jgi:uncharacterized UBP type Zn finger protein
MDRPENPECTHLDEIDLAVAPSGPGCRECLISGGRWMHLRRCLICGHIGCCDNSPNRHATMHFHETGHPVIQSYEPREDWVYCYADDAFMEAEEFGDSPSHPPGWSPGPPREWRRRQGLAPG